MKQTSLIHAAVVGLAAGFLAVAFQLSVAAAERLGSWASTHALSNGFLGISLMIASASCLGGVAAWAIGRWAPEAGGSGIPHIKAALQHLRIIRPVPLIIAKFLGGLAALATGMSLGREGPTVQMGASVGKIVGDGLRAPRRSRGVLIAAGAGAGLAAAFNAPLAGFLFVMEELKREMSALTYGSALIACVCSVGVTRYLLGQHPSFNLPSPGTAPLRLLPFTAVLGAVAGLAGVLFNKSLLGALHLRNRFKIPRWVYGAVAAALAAASLCFFPHITGGGHQVLESLLAGTQDFRPILGVVLFIFAAKLFLTCLSYGTGLPGGIFAPILVMGGFIGYGFGIVAHSVAPNVAFSSEGFATLGMAAMLASSVRAPLTGVVLIVEMTAEYGLLYALLVSAFVATLVADALRDKPVYEALMERDLRLSGAEIHPEEEPLLIEILVEPNSAMDGRRVKALKLPPGAIVATLERGSQHIVPGGSTLLSAGDMITVLVDGAKPELSLLIHEMAGAP